MRVGWLEDLSQQDVGGARITAQETLSCKPDDIEIVSCRPAGSWEDDLDAFVVMRAWDYGLRNASELRRRKKPILLSIHDMWQYPSDPSWRSWVLKNATMVRFLSPLHRQRFRWDIGERAQVVELPAYVNQQPYLDALADRPERHGVCWLGRFENGKGVHVATRWAEEQKRLVTFYGTGWIQPRGSRYVKRGGYVPHERVPQVLASHETFLFLPTGVEPFGRTVAEAAMARCNLIVSGDIGALHWLEQGLDTITNAGKDFWEMVRSL